MQTPPPAADLQYIVFDSNRNPTGQKGFFRVTTASNMAKAKVTMPEITIEQPGFIYIFVYNRSDSPNWVFFDEMLVTHEHSAVVAGADYYPFGLAMDGREITDEPYRWGYQGQYAQENDSTGWNEFQLRMYDARFGRWLSPDPYGQFWSPYVGMGNNPVSLTDRDGGCAGIGCISAATMALADAAACTAVGLSGTAASLMSATTAAAIARGSGGYEIEFNLNVPTGPLGNVDSYQPTGAQLNRWSSPAVDTSIPRPDTSPITSFLTSKPSFAESIIPVWGSGREAAAAFSAGNYWTGAGYTLLAISDVFLVKAIATAGVKLAVRGTARVFWSGGEAAMNAATNYAKATGGTTIGMTRAGKNLERLIQSRNIPWDGPGGGHEMWRRLSVMYARGAKGPVHFFPGPTLNPKSIWFVEKEILIHRGIPIITH